ncbi:MAG: YchJ family protein [Marmoricola sp.]
MAALGSSRLDPTAPCPCGSGRGYDACCGPVVRNERSAEGPEELMRSRYTAYAVNDVDHLFRTWHPRTRPEEIAPDDGLTWAGLEVLDVETGETTGVVEFRAHWRWNGQRGSLHERSRFEVRGGRWVYLDGEKY